jgi:Geranylgeranyl pyrophosphate synthase
MSININEIKDYAKFFNEKLVSFFNNIEPQILKNSSLHILINGGKRLRPYVLSKISSYYGLDNQKSFPAALSVELVHNFSLIHDDIMDKDKFRHGKPTVHEAYGLDFAILSGDLLFALAFKSLYFLKNFIPKSRITQCYKELSIATESLAIGQGLDICLAKNSIFDYRKTIKMIQNKTSALFEASCVMGAIIGNAKQKEIEQIRKFARYAGIAFQIKDDILGTFGDEKITGKPVGNDLKEGKKTLIVIYAMKKGNAELRKMILSILGNPNAREEEIRQLIASFKNMGCDEFAIKKSNYYLNLANQHLKGLKQDLAEFLRSFGEFLVERNY